MNCIWLCWHQPARKVWWGLRIRQSLESGEVGKCGRWWCIVPKAVCLLRLHQNLDEIILMILIHLLLRFYIHLLLTPRSQKQCPGRAQRNIPGARKKDFHYKYIEINLIWTRSYCCPQGKIILILLTFLWLYHQENFGNPTWNLRLPEHLLCARHELGTGRNSTLKWHCLC